MILFLDSCSLRNKGSNNKVHIHADCNLHWSEVWIEGDGNIVEIGESTIIIVNTHHA